MVIGIFFMVFSIVHKYRRNENTNMAYLGIFSFAFGIWRITNIQFAPLMFNKNPMAVSYISLTMLILAIIPWAFSVKKQFLKKSYPLLEWCHAISCIGSIMIIMMQIANILDMRRSLSLIHTMIVVVAVMTVGTVIYEGNKKKANNKAKVLYVCLLTCILGISMDIISYYIKRNEADIFYTPIAFIFYIVIMGYLSISEINKKANIDMHTGVFNKSRCNELLDENEIISDSQGIIMFDLNRLKYTNDTFGHDKGDVLISQFANILRENISNQNFVGRFGGDEFIVVIKAADEDQVLMINDKILKAVEQYNTETDSVSMSYSMGYALSEDYPGLTLRELLQKADGFMYRNKKAYHESIEANI